MCHGRKPRYEVYVISSLSIVASCNEKNHAIVLKLNKQDSINLYLYINKYVEGVCLYIDYFCAILRFFYPSSF